MGLAGHLWGAVLHPQNCSRVVLLSRGDSSSDLPFRRVKRVLMRLLSRFELRRQGFLSRNSGLLLRGQSSHSLHKQTREGLLMNQILLLGPLQEPTSAQRTP